MTLSLGRSCACGGRVAQATRTVTGRCPSLPLTWRRRWFATSSQMLCKSFRSTDVRGSGLWGMHQPHSPARMSLARNHVVSTAAHREKGVLPGGSPPHSDAMLSPAGAPSPTNFTLDPPFTRVAGEEEVSPGPCDYVCRRCCALVFRSSSLVRTSRVGRHESGWPTFVAPSTPSALRLATVLQKSLVAGLSDTSRHESVSNISTGLTTPRRPLGIAVPHNSVVQRGLSVEGDLVRRRGRQICRQEAKTWREACLRDENHRADPAVALGLCSTCGTPLCHVTQSAAEGTRYVSTAAFIAAQAEDTTRRG
nr:unnamed protein product [Leishmania braziliensis]